MKFDDLSISAKIMYQEAQRMGIEVEMFEDDLLLKMNFRGLEWYTKGSRTSIQSSIGKSIADNKDVTKVVLSKYGIPTANYCLVESIEQIEEAFKELQSPLVFKPVDGYQGVDVYVGVDSPTQARSIIEGKPVKTWIAEELLVGKEFRVVCVDHKFIAAALRLPAFVIGNGVDDIGTLIQKKNQHPSRSSGHLNYLTKIEIDEDLLSVLTSSGRNLESIPEHNERVVLRRVCNLSRGGEVMNVTNLVSMENKALFEEVSRVTDLNIMGIDVMCEDLGRSLSEQNQAGIVEINTSPGLMIHHTPYDPSNSVNVARKILEMTIRKIALLNGQ